jgi:uncharacterized integral membrane protein
MKVIAPILTSLIVGLLASGIAILSVQNATPISLKLVNFESIPLSIGVILAFSFSIGAFLAAILLPLLFSKDSPNHHKSHQHQDI